MKTQATDRKTRAGLPWAFAVLALLGLFVLWACHLGPEDGQDTFHLEGDTAWTHCDTVRIILLDGDGDPLDTLYNDSLRSLDDLKKLDASRYDGGSGGIAIRGLYRDGRVCFEQNRAFESGGTKVKVDTVLDPNVAPTGLSVEPEELVLTMGSPPANLNAKVTPDYADPSVAWTTDGSGVVELETLVDGKGNPARVKPLKAGLATLKVRSLKDTTISFVVAVRVTSPGTGGIRLGKDTVVLYVKGPAESLTVAIPAEYAGQKMEWKTGNIDIAQVDNLGRIKPGKEGETNVQATLNPSGLSDVALVQVKLDKPVLKVNSAKGGPVGAEIAFNAVATQAFGTIVAYKWDLDDAGFWDDSVTGVWSGDTVRLPEVKGRFNKEGTAVTRFLVRDSEGNETQIQVLLEIGNQAPEIISLRADTIISVKDSIAMRAVARDVDGKVKWMGWDYEGDGLFDDTAAADTAEARLERGRRFHEAGTYKAVFRARDDNGKAGQDTAVIKVEFDAPVADAGPDQTVLAGAPVTIPVKGTDRFGRIVKREIKVGDQPFITLPDGKEEVTQNAPDRAMTVRFIIRVTDDDDLTDQDTVEVAVILSSNADLTDLLFSAGPLSPVFTPNAKTYQARVAFADSLVTITPKVRDGSTSITVNGEQVESGKPSREVKLALGRNVDAFAIVTTAADGTQLEYSITITRDPNGEATLSKLEAPGLTLSPDFAPATLEYSDTVLYPVSTVTFKPTVASAGATLAFKDSAMVSGTFTAPQPLEFGDNVFTFVVTAMDGKSRSAYTVRIHRLGRLIVQRKLGAAAATVVDSFDLSTGASRQVSGAGPAGWRFLKWTVLEGSATLADSAATPTQATLGSGLAKVQANFEILKYDITVTSSGCGKVDPGTVTLDHGASQEFRLVPAAGCRIQSVKVDGSDEPSAYDSVHTFAAVTSKHSLDVVFVRTFSFSVKSSGKGSVTPQSAIVDSGSKVVFTVQPESGNKVALKGVCDEKGDCFDPRSDGTFGVEAATQGRTFTVAFVPALRMQGTVSGGIGTISPVDSTVDNLSTVTWRWTVDPRYRIVAVMLDTSEVKPTSENSLELSGVTSGHAVELRLKRRYQMTYDVGPGGSLSPQPVAMDSNSTPRFTATPDAGYRVDSVIVNDTLVATNGLDKWSPQGWQLAPVTRANTIKVRFKRYYNISTKLGGGGSLTPENANIDSGATQTWTLGLASGYRVTALDLNNRSLLPNLSGNTLTLANVTEGGTITGGFSNIYTIIAGSNLTKGLRVPEICIKYDGGSACSENGVLSVSLPYGTTFYLSGPDQIPPLIRTDPILYFHYWEYGKMGNASCDNPLREIVGGDMLFTATYEITAPKECAPPF